MDDALLATISLALQAVTTVDERRRCLTQILHDHRSIEATVEVVRDEHASGDRIPPRTGGRHPRAPSNGSCGRGREVGVLRLRNADGSPLDLRPAFVDALSVRVGLAIENAVLYERERDASHALQIGLLGGPLPQVPACELGASYRSAGATLEVGGDWYDAFEFPSGRLALVVGDVVGKGLDAAIAMGELRGAVRSLATLSTPAELLARLDEVVANVPEARWSTLVYVEYDPSSGHIRHASAGHPPPVVVTATTATGRLLSGGRSTPLGYARERDRSEARNILAERDLLVLYTDGLVERRAAGIDEGLARLRTRPAGWRSSRSMPSRTASSRPWPRRAGSPTTCARSSSGRTRGTSSPTWSTVPRGPVGVPHRGEGLARHARGQRRGRAGRDPRHRRGGVELDRARVPGGLVDRSTCGARSPTGGICCAWCATRGRWVEPAQRDGRGWGRGIMATVMDDVEVDTCTIGTEIRLTRRLSG